MCIRDRYEAPGIGLAATQVDIHLQLIVIDASETRDQLLALINPETVSYTHLDVYKRQRHHLASSLYEQVRRRVRCAWH